MTRLITVTACWLWLSCACSTAAVSAPAAATGVVATVPGLPDSGNSAGNGQANYRHGQGRYDNGAGLVYEGGWLDGRRHGKGVETRPDGSRYHGQWVADKRSGTGRETWPDGSWHDGEWELNQPRGPGVRHYRNGIEINGTFAGGHATSGMLVLPSGETYAGPLHNTAGVPHAGMLRWLEAAAARGDPWAGLLLAKGLLAQGPAGEHLPATLAALRTAAAGGLPEADWLLAITLPTDAAADRRTHLESAAGRGHPGAQVRLAQSLLRDCANDDCALRANALLEAATAAGDRTARHLLAQSRLADDPALARDLIRSFAISFGDWRDLELLAGAEAALGMRADAADHLHAALMAARQDESDANSGDLERLQGLLDGLEDHVDPTEHHP